MKKSLISNEVYEEAYTGRLFRVLYIDKLRDYVFLLEMNKQLAYPAIVSYEDLIDNIDKRIYLRKEQTLKNSFPQLTENQKSRSQLLWDIIKDFVVEEPACYESDVRAKFAGEAAKKSNMTRTAIEKILYKYWARGKTPESLIPDYNKRGRKTILNSTDRSGKKKTKKAQLSAGDVSNINSIVEKYYNKTSKTISLTAAYNIFLDKYYRDPETKNLRTCSPSFSQFYYHAKKAVNERKRTGERNYKKDNRPIIGSSHSEAIAPGDVYQIDATEMGFYLVAQPDPTKLVGKPTLYSVVDVYSHAIVGVSLGLGKPSWEWAALALEFAFKDKTDACAQYKVEQILAKQGLDFEWPCKGLPQKIMVDNAELISKVSNQLVSQLRIEVENAPAWRPDLKGIVEQSFRQYHITLKPYVGGYVEKKSRERGDPDYKLYAELNIYQFTQMIILAVLKHNALALTRDFILDEDERNAHLAPIPIERWKWGIENRGGNLRNLDSKTIELGLLKQKNVSITPHGIRMGKKLYYTCPKAIKEGWFDRGATKKGPRECKVAYDPHNMEEIYVIAPDGEVFSAGKAPDYNDFFGWVEEDFNSYFETQKDERTDRHIDQKNIELRYNDALSSAVTESKLENEKKVVKPVPMGSYIDKKSIKGSSIRKNQAEEKELLRMQRRTFNADPESVARPTPKQNNTEGKNPTDSIGLAIKRLLEEEE